MTRQFIDARALAARHFLAPRLDPRHQDLLQDPRRRDLLKAGGGAGLGLAGAMLLGACHDGYDDDGYRAGNRGGTSLGNGLSSTDTKVLNFALNLEYLEAEFYQRAVNGSGLPGSMIGGTRFDNAATYGSAGDAGNAGTVTGGRQVSFATPAIRQLAREIAHNEMLHVGLVRGALGALVVARPAIDLQDAFTGLFRTAGIIGPNEAYDPYANEANFLLAASVFEDVGVTAYKGSATLLESKDVLETASGILAAEAYHASILRTLLYNLGVDMPALNTRTNFDKLSDARDSVDGNTERDQGISPGQGINTTVNTPNGTNSNDTSNIAPADANAIAFGRTAMQVLNVAYQTPGMSWAGGFFPQGVNGSIYTSNTSAANNAATA